ncbi:MAG: amidohydrolase family protein, partial [Rhodospirillales bacterium]|nr:amidohydrolase family protein [Rhodospirillales bacterium]
SHFSFEMARKVMGAGILPYTLGADMHGYNVKIPEEGGDAVKQANPFFGVAPFNLTNAMTKLLTLGMKLPDVVATVTGNPAKMLGMENEIGALRPGMEADVSVLDLLDGSFELSDNSGVRVVASQLIHPVMALKAGVRFDSNSPLIPPVLAAA